MGEKCKTTRDEKWLSDVKKSREGEFVITEEDGDGFFVGTFTTGGKTEDIRGRCDGKKMYFLRPTDKPRFYYEGEFKSEKNLSGTQTSLPVTKDKANRVSEEWEGTKVPSTFEGD